MSSFAAAPAGCTYPRVVARAIVLCLTLGACLLIPAGAHAAGWSVQPIPPAAVPRGQISAMSCTSQTFCIAVGSLVDSSGNTGTLAQRWNGRAWSSQRMPAVGGLSSVSCTSRRACTAVANNRVMRWNGRRWAIQQTLGPAISLSAVSCWSRHGCTAVGENGDGAPFAESWNGRWSKQSAQDPGGLEDGLSTVSCTSARACMAVGFDVIDSSGDETTLAERWNGRGWSLESSLDAGNDQFSGVACSSAVRCIAVGSYFNGAGTERPLVERWVGGRWSFAVAARPAGARSGRLVGISCSSQRTCTAVGSFTSAAGKTFVLAERSKGSGWSVYGASNATQNGIENFVAISCWSPERCRAVGPAQNGSDILSEPLHGSHWVSSALIDPLGPLPSVLNGVSCPSPTSCIAVGSFVPGNSMPLAETWNGSAWTTENVPTPAGAASAQLNAVSCPSVATCTAVGSSTMSDGGSSHGLVETWSGGSWRIQSSPQVADSALTGVSCGSPTSCVAVGAQSSGAHTLAQVWNGSTWAIEPTPEPPTAEASVLNAVSCSAATACTAVGSTTDRASGSSNALAERWNGSSWTVQVTPSTTLGEDELNAVSCPSSSACTAVGESDSEQTLVDRWDGTTWTTEAAPNARGSGASVLKAVACASAIACTAVGYSQRSGNETLAETWSDGGWSVQSTPSPSGAMLNDVACPSAEMCTAIGGFNTSADIQLPLLERFS